VTRWLFILLAVALAWFSTASNAHAHKRASQAAYDAGAPVEKVVLVAGITMDTSEGDNTDPLSLHKYLYCQGNPINGIDPSGHWGLFSFTRDFGNWAHRVIEDEYLEEHPGAICGTTTGILGTGLKPDIFDGPNRVFMEIKPLSISGVAKGIVQIGGYDLAFSALRLGYTRGTWPNSARQSNVGATPIVYFNVQGVIFYTDYTDNIDDFAVITSFALVRQFIINNSAMMARTLVPSFARIAQIIEAAIPAMEVDAVPVGEL
jgi:hypothetical protein